MTNPKKLRSNRRRRRRKAAKKMVQENNILQVLPSHIIADITLRLPIKSIVHCMRVCKTWRNIVLEPYFADLHLSTSPRRSTDDKFMCYTKKNSKAFTLVPIENPTLIAREDLLVFAIPKQLSVLNVSLVYESANGLICLSNVKMDKGYAGRTFYIYNPLLKEYAVLPRPPINLSTEDCEDRYDFGFCPKTRQYKVVRGVTEYSSGVEVSKRCEIYTLGTPAWRQVSNGVADELCDHLRYGTCVLNGAIHFLAKRDDHNGNVISCFDLEIEEFVPFPQPPVVDANNLKLLGVLDNCLIATCSREDMNSAGVLEVWVMQEYTTNWTKKCQIYYSAQVDWKVDYDFCGNYKWCIEQSRPRKLLNDGRLVLSYLDQFYLYDPEEKHLTKSEIPGGSWLLLTPTFVSPKKVMGQISSNDTELPKNPTSKRMRLR